MSQSKKSTPKSIALFITAYTWVASKMEEGVSPLSVLQTLVEHKGTLKLTKVQIMDLVERLLYAARAEYDEEFALITTYEATATHIKGAAAWPTIQTIAFLAEARAEEEEMKEEERQELLLASSPL